MNPLLIIVPFFVLHWQLSVFFQTFFLHRYGAHRMVLPDLMVRTSRTARTPGALPRDHLIAQRKRPPFMRLQAPTTSSM